MDKKKWSEPNQQTNDLVDEFSVVIEKKKKT